MPKQVVLVPGIAIPPSPFNHVVRAGDFLFVSSQLSVNLTTHTLLSGDIARQTRQALENLKLNTSKRVPRRLASQSKRSLLCQESMWRLTLLLISRPDGRRAHEEPQLARPDVHDPGDDLRHQGPGLSFTGAGRVRSFRRGSTRFEPSRARPFRSSHLPARGARPGDRPGSGSGAHRFACARARSPSWCGVRWASPWPASFRLPWWCSAWGS